MINWDCLTSSEHDVNFRSINHIAYWLYFTLIFIEPYLLVTRKLHKILEPFLGNKIYKLLSK